MREIWNWIQVLAAAVGGWLGYNLGGMDGFLYALLAFVTLDYLTGIAAAIVEKKLSSDIGFRGIVKKVLIFVMVAVGHIIDKQIIGDGSGIRTAVIFFYLSNEGLSVLENAARIGLPIPEKIKEILSQLNSKDGKGE
ncbi:phage holin family protein [Acetanaerobacterium elongatum]|nr:phage holin family protein [Acetanaerobacterium elongatum]